MQIDINYPAYTRRGHEYVTTELQFDNPYLLSY